MDALKISKPLHSTWCGRKGSVQTYSFDHARHGKRIIVQRWENGHVDVRAIKGNGRLSDFVEFEAAKLVHPTDADIEAQVKRLSAYFA
jgi:hypothetical protein